MKHIRGLCEDLTDRLELPREAVGGEAKLTMWGDRRLLIENHRGVLAYGTEEIRVAAGRRQLVVRGAQLYMSAMNREELLVCGRMQSLEWE